MKMAPEQAIQLKGINPIKIGFGLIQLKRQNQSSEKASHSVSFFKFSHVSVNKMFTPPFINVFF